MLCIIFEMIMPEMAGLLLPPGKVKQNKNKRTKASNSYHQVLLKKQPRQLLPNLEFTSASLQFVCPQNSPRLHLSLDEASGPARLEERLGSLAQKNMWLLSNPRWFSLNPNPIPKYCRQMQ